MIIETDVIGKVEYADEDIINFEEGLYGFGGMKKFILILNPIPELPFHYLQSIDDPRLNFVVTSPFLFIENYDFEINDTVVEKMNIDDINDIDIYSITIIAEEIEETTINLKAPIIVNRKNQFAKQFILNEDYPYKKLIFKKEELED